MKRNNENWRHCVEKADWEQVQDSGKVFGFGFLGFLVLVLLTSFSVKIVSA